MGAAPLLSLICASGANTLSRRSAGNAAVGGDGGISTIAAAAAVLRLLGRLKSRKTCYSNLPIYLNFCFDANKPQEKPDGSPCSMRSKLSQPLRKEFALLSCYNAFANLDFLASQAAALPLSTVTLTLLGWPLSTIDARCCCTCRKRIFSCYKTVFVYFPVGFIEMVKNRGLRLSELSPRSRRSQGVISRNLWPRF